MRRIVVAVDGPAGAGKSTISKMVAKRLDLAYIDTGAMYRAVTLKMLEAGISFDDTIKAAEVLEGISITFNKDRIILDGVDVSEAIRLPKVNEKVSIVAAMPKVRELLVTLQRRMGQDTNVIMDGRDIGTNVLTEANYKIYLTASVEERAQRRFLELTQKGLDVDYNDIYNEIGQRDEKDSSRELNPLRQAEDAVLVDTTGKGIDEVVEEIIGIINR